MSAKCPLNVRLAITLSKMSDKRPINVRLYFFGVVGIKKQAVAMSDANA